jgi:hypothetical protein
MEMSVTINWPSPDKSSSWKLALGRGSGKFPVDDNAVSQDLGFSQLIVNFLFSRTFHHLSSHD